MIEKERERWEQTPMNKRIGVDNEVITEELKINQESNPTNEDSGLSD